MDSKRQNTQGRVATPKAVGATGLDLDATLTKAVGGRVRLTTHPTPSLPPTIEGILFTYDSSVRLLALSLSSKLTPSAPCEYRVLPLSAIASATPLGNESFDEEINGLVGGPKTDPDVLKKREESAVQSLKGRDATRNKGAGKEGQAIFDWFSRQYQMSWSNNSIIVNNGVRIDPPYRIEDCKAPKDKKQAETHIRKLLTGYYERNGRETPVNAPKGVVPALPRKGG